MTAPTRTQVFRTVAELQAGGWYGDAKPGQDPWTTGMRVYHRTHGPRLIEQHEGERGAWLAPGPLEPPELSNEEITKLIYILQTGAYHHKGFDAAFEWALRQVEVINEAYHSTAEIVSMANIWRARRQRPGGELP